MATQTTNYRLDKPTVGGDADAWGGFLNNNTIDKIDGFMAKPGIIRVVPTVAATIQLDLSLARVFVFTTTGAHTITFINWPTLDPTNPVLRVLLIISNGGLGALTFDAGVTWDEGNKPLFEAAGKNVIEMTAVAPTGVGSEWFARQLYTSGKKSFPRVSATISANFVVTADASVAIAFDGTEDYDTHAMHDVVTNNSRLTVPSGQAGAYHLRVQGTMIPAGTSPRYEVKIRKNNATDLKATYFPAVNTGIIIPFVVEAVDPSAIVGDFYEVFTDDTTGGLDYTLEGGVTKTTFSAERIA